jgi:hypothetical protein
MWVATNDLPRSAAHPFYARLSQILDQHDFDGFVQGLCQRFYAEDGRPEVPPGRYFRLLLRCGHARASSRRALRTAPRTSSWLRPRRLFS